MGNINKRIYFSLLLLGLICSWVFSSGDQDTSSREADNVVKTIIIQKADVEITTAQENGTVATLLTDLGKTAVSVADQSYNIIVDFVGLFTTIDKEKMNKDLTNLADIFAYKSDRATSEEPSDSTGDYANQKSIMMYFEGYLAESFHRQGYKITERENLESIIDEQELQLSGITENSVKTGRLVNATHIFTSQLLFDIREVKDLFSTYFIYKIQFNGKITEVESGVIYKTAIISKEFSELNENVMKQLVDAWFSKNFSGY